MQSQFIPPEENSGSSILEKYTVNLVAEAKMVKLTPLSDEKMKPWRTIEIFVAPKTIQYSLAILE